jgi:hypothetical protein
MPNERIATAEQRELIVLAVETTAERRDLYLSAEQRELLRQAAALLRAEAEGAPPVRARPSDMRMQEIRSSARNRISGGSKEMRRRTGQNPHLFDAGRAAIAMRYRRGEPLITDPSAHRENSARGS